MEFRKKNSASLLRPWKWDFEYEYNPDFDLGMGDWMSDSDNEDVLFDDDLLFGKENERAVALSLDRLLQNASALVSNYPAKRKRRLQTPVTVLQLLWTSKLLKKRQRD